jgi:SWI/SNF-related matrix-associated actin-dependent regulator of chromatin subfamily D
MDMQKPVKRRKLTDKNVPNAILQSQEFSVDSQMYQDLLNMEKKLDWTMTRKRVEVQDTLGRPMSVSVALVSLAPVKKVY